MTAIGRFPKSLGVPDGTSSSAVLEPELFTRPLQKSNCLTVFPPQVDVMVVNSQEELEVTILNLTAEHCQADCEVYYRWIKWDGRIAVPGTGAVAIETAIAPAAAVLPSSCTPQPRLGSTYWRLGLRGVRARRRAAWIRSARGSRL